MSSKTTVTAILFLIIGAPMVLYVWRVVDEVLGGNVHLVSVVVALVLACTFAGLVYLMGRALEEEAGGGRG